jgi:hypothetical protein
MDVLLDVRDDIGVGFGHLTNLSRTNAPYMKVKLSMEGGQGAAHIAAQVAVLWVHRGYGSHWKFHVSSFGYATNSGSTSSFVTGSILSPSSSGSDIVLATGSAPRSRGRDNQSDGAASNSFSYF